jgi:simple sugar transport system ATP-binding protein
MTHASPRALTGAGMGVVPEDRHAEACVPALSVAENLFIDRLPEFRRFGCWTGGPWRAPPSC